MRKTGGLKSRGKYVDGIGMGAEGWGGQGEMRGWDEGLG